MGKSLANDLNADATKELSELLKKIDAVDGNWIEDRSTKVGNTVELDIWVNPLTYNAMRFLHDHSLFVEFDWTSWDEGKQFLRTENEAAYKTIDRDYTLKLLTMAVRGGRFVEGSWGSFFESGKAQLLLHRLLDLERLDGANKNR